MSELKPPLMVTLVALSVLGTLSGCQKNEEGPAETAGRQIDQMVEKSGERMDQVTDELGKSVKKVGQRVQDAAQQKGK